MNRNFAKPKADMTPEYAPDVLEINGRKVYNPKAVHCKIAGYLPLSPDWPVDPPQGKHYQRTDKIEPNGADGYRWTYTLVDDPPPPPRTFSKLKLYAVLSAANLWDALKAWLEAQTYEGMNAWTAFSLAQDLTEDHPMFAKWYSAAKTALGVDDATAEELLARCVKEGY